MYETSFGFTARPFAASPQSRCYYSGGPVELARKTITECIERSEGPALLIGPAGSGKSLVCYQLAQQFQDRYQVVMLADARIGSRKTLLQNVLFDLGLSYRDMDEGELRLALIDHLDPKNEDSPGLLLLVDEADALSVELLEEVRMITNLVRDGESRVRLVLAGGPDLEAKFADPRLETFNHRIARRCYLHSLNEHQTTEYVKAQIEGVGGDAGGMFTDEAMAAIFTASDGSPRIINQVCDHALLLNSVSGSHAIDADAISEAWADLQQMPEPWEDEPADSTPSFIEFGELAAEPDTPSTPTPTEEPAPFVNEKPEQLQDAPPQIETNEIIADALSKLDSIQHEVEKVSQEDAPAESSSAIGDVSQPAQSSPDTAEETDPFGDDFEDEEAVVDPYQSVSVTPATPSSPEPTDSAIEFENAEDTILESSDEEPTGDDSRVEEPVAAHESVETFDAMEDLSESGNEENNADVDSEEFIIVNKEPGESLSTASRQSELLQETEAKQDENHLDFSLSKEDILEQQIDQTNESESEFESYVEQTAEVSATVENQADSTFDIETQGTQDDASPLVVDSASNSEEVASEIAEADEASQETPDKDDLVAPMHTVQLDAQSMNLAAPEAAENDDSSFEITPELEASASASNDDEITSPMHTVQLNEAEIQAAGGPSIESPLHTVQLSSDELQSSSEDQDFFSIETESDSEADDSRAEAAATPGQWSLAEPIKDDPADDESFFSVEGEATEETPVSVMKNVQEAEVDFQAPESTGVVSDDRDMIVVEEAAEEAIKDERPQARRQEYRQLFARLRKSQN